jgi:hypothetical protein
MNLNFNPIKKTKEIFTKSFILFVVILLSSNSIFSQEKETVGNLPNEEYSAGCLLYLCPPLHTSPAFLVTVNNADELYQTLSCIYRNYIISLSSSPYPIDCYLSDPPCTAGVPPGYIPSCSTQVVIRIPTGVDVDLGDLDPSVFPLEVPPGVTIEGTYSLSNISSITHRSLGTRITFPYMYAHGAEPRVPYKYLTSLNPGCNLDPAFAFKLNDGAHITRVCLMLA